MAIWDPPTEIGILLYPEVASATVHGLTDLFTVATTLVREHLGPTAPTLRISHWQPGSTNNAIECVFDTHPQFATRPVSVIVPGSWKGQPASEVRRRLVQWLIERHAAGTTLCSVCGGAFILAETGLLAGRSVTTHWSLKGELADRFPEIQVDESRLTIEDGNFITAGGVLAWADLGLKLVDRYLGPTIMLRTSQFMLADPPGREQRYYSHFSPKLHHGDSSILKVQHWLQTQATKKPSVSEMAKAGGLEPRTLHRRFQKATGLKPNEYSQHLRVGKAREMLEFTNRTVDQVASAVGYEDPSSFRRVFQRVVGLSPGAYRRRFAAANAARTAT
ncbi:MAG TPA: helix-turn-helix domain-containing protein [Micropepsaceae bacterium]|jgi:transcriptional regulator GlxA family with amidase domain